MTTKWRPTVPRYTMRGWAEMKQRNGYALTNEDKEVLGLTDKKGGK